MKDWDEAVAFALALPNTERSTSYRQPAVKVDGKTFLSTGHEPGSFHVRSPHDEKAVLIETDPATFWQTPHYEGWPGLLVRHGSADPERVRLVITRAWWDMASPPRAAAGGSGREPLPRHSGLGPGQLESRRNAGVTRVSPSS